MKQPHEKRNIKISIRLTEQENQTLVEEADICALSLSSFLRQRGLGKRISAKSDLRVLSELRRICGLLKHIHNETKGAYSAKTAKAIDEITAFVHLLNDELQNRGNRDH